MMNRALTSLSCLLVIVGSIPAQAEPKVGDWNAAGFRLTCLPYQDTALLEPYYLDHIPDDAQMPAFKRMLAKQGIYIGDKVVNGYEETPLKTTCQLGKHKISLDFSYNSNTTMGKYYDDGTFMTLVSRQHCASVSYLKLKSLKVDGVEWYQNEHFAHDCLDSQVLRMRINPKLKYFDICTQNPGGSLEEGPLAISYTPIQLDEQGNPPSPTITCKTISMEKETARK